MTDVTGLDCWGLVTYANSTVQNLLDPWMLGLTMTFHRL